MGRLVVSPVQLEPSHTLLESHNPKLVSVLLLNQPTNATTMTKPLPHAGVWQWTTAPSKHSDILAQPFSLPSLLTEPHHGLGAQHHESG